MTSILHTKFNSKHLVQPYFESESINEDLLLKQLRAISPEKLKEFWWERFIEALENKKPLLHNMSYTELPIMWLNAYTQQQSIIDEKDDRISHLVKVKKRANSEIEALKKRITELEKPLD